MEILAKSKPTVTLKKHIEDCLEIQKQLKPLFSNIPIENKDEFWDLLYISMVFHDLGKAHKEFQSILRKGKGRWLQRHELFSLPFIQNLSLPNEQKNLVLFAVAGHHKDFDNLFDRVFKSYQSDENENSDDIFDNNCGKLNFRKEFETIETQKLIDLTRLFLSQSDSLTIQLDSSALFHQPDFSIDIFEFVRDFKLRKSNVESDDDFFLKLLLSGATKQCDHLASADIKKLYSLDEKDFDSLSSIPTPYLHQTECSKMVGNMILNAPTGSGKTEAAFLWLQNQMNKFGQGRVFYTLPFTASINAMYERLNDKIPSDPKKIGMVHGKLEEYVENKFEDDENNIFDNFEETAEKKKQMIDDFKTLVTPVKIVTPFQLLKHFFGVKGFEKGLFELSGSYLIFDEIHAYDSATFAQIIIMLRFVTQKLNAKILIMTATLPTFMKKLIVEAIGDCSFVQANDELYDSFERHRIKLLNGKLGDNLEFIQEYLDDGKKVLVVCNTVAESQNVYEKLNSENKVLLHGSFNSEDRFKKEHLLKSESVKLLVGTQSIEISLDIDFGMIFSEPAPFDALIQRFGRVNRRRERGICDCFVFTERNKNDSFIYTDDEIIRTLEVLEKIEQESDGIIQEKTLHEKMDFVYPDWNEKEKKEYMNIINLLEYFVYNGLYPCQRSENEEEYYKQFKGIRVLPAKCKKKYEAYLENNQFIKADGLLIQITEPRFIGLIKKGEIESDTFSFQLKRTEKFTDKSVFVIKRKYDSELGLQMNKEDIQKSFQII